MPPEMGHVAGGGLTPIPATQALSDLLDFTHKDHVRFGMGWSIDDLCGAIGLGEMALMWARSSAGKSTWYLNVLRNTPDVPTLVVNMEMTPRRQLEWLASMTWDFPVAAKDVEEVLRWGQDDPRYDALMAYLSQVSEVYPNLHFLQPSSPTVDDISTVIDDIADSTGTKPLRVVVDHVGLLAGCFDYQGYTRTAAALHSLALEQDIALIALQQVGRGGGEAGRNDGHLPITFSSGLYGGEQDADYVYGLYRPDRDPKFKKSRYQFSDPNDWYQMQEDYAKVRGLVVLQCIKNRPFSELCEDGIHLQYNSWSRRYEELGAQ